MEVMIISGTARKDSNTAKVAENISTRLELNHESELFDISEKEIPFLGNRTYRDEGPVPEDIKDFSQKVESADCIIIVSPEYNHSIPGALKTTLDYLWPEYQGKLFSYIGVSDENYGAVRAINDLEKITRVLEGIPGPKLPISNISRKIEGSHIRNEKLDSRLNDFIEALEKFNEEPLKNSNPYLG